MGSAVVMVRGSQDPGDEGDGDSERHPEMPGHGQENGQTVSVTAPVLAVGGRERPICGPRDLRNLAPTDV